MQIQPALAGLDTSHPNGDRPQNIVQAASSFEALMIGELLKTVRASSEGTLTGEADGAAETMREVADEHLAAELARNGGLGFARLIVSQLSENQTAGSATGATSQKVSSSG